MSHIGLTSEQAIRAFSRPLGLGLDNVLLDTDSYKASHAVQYPPGTERVYSYIESRGGDFPAVVFFGLQAFIKEYLLRPITKAQVDEASAFWAAHGEPVSRERLDRLVEVHGGRWPVEIRALPEGSVSEPGTVLLTVVNTDPEFPWVTSFLETALLRAVWYPTTVATVSRACKAEIKRAFDRTSDDPSGLLFKLHDFGARGVSSKESAAIGGLAHLVNFRGTDTVSGVLAGRAYYHEDMAGFSIPAAEHSTITSWGREGEVEAYRNQIRQFGGGALFAVVSDSYDIFNAVSNIWGGVLRDEVLAMNATLVIRPDSGDPVTTPIRVIELLGERFGYTVNSKGYKVLNPKVRVIQGDGITPETIHRIVYTLCDLKGWSIDNIAFGMGGGLLQHCNRDTLKFAMKCSAAQVNGEWVDVYKDPVGQADKRSKRGRFMVVDDGRGGLANWPVDSLPAEEDQLQAVYRDGVLHRDHTFAEVRARAELR